MLPQPGLHAPSFHNLGSHLNNNSSSLNNGPGLLGTSGNLPPSGLLSAAGNVTNPGLLATGNPMNTPTGGPGLLTRPFPISIPNSNLQSDTSPHSNHSGSPVTGQSYMNFSSNSHLMSGNRVKRSNTPNSENSTGSLSPLNTTGSDCEINGSCRCGIINCVAGNEHVHRSQNLPNIYIQNPPSPDVKVEGLTGVYAPTATPAAPNTLLIPAKNNFSSKDKDVTIINDTPGPKLFKPYKSDVAERA